MTPQDRDLLIRTIIGEAGDQPDIGKAAVAHVVMNRLQSGHYGASPSDIVLARNQFEPWSSKPKQLLAIKPSSDQYQKVGQIVDQVESGQIPDPTGGATNFYAPKLQSALGRKTPDWAQGNGVKIGDHSFYASNAQGAISKALGSAPQGPAQALAYDDPDQVLSQYGVKRSAASSAPSAPTGSAPTSPDDILQQYGVTRGAASTAPAAPEQAAPTQAAAPAALPTGMGYENQVVEGMPIIGPLMNKAIAATGAAIQPMFVKPKSVTDLVTGQTRPGSQANFWDRYQANLADIEGGNKQFAAEHPVGSTLANLTGGGMALSPLAATRVGGTLLGTYGPSLASRIVTGATGGALINSTDAALRGESPGTAAEIGAAGGAAGPIIGEGFRLGTRAASNYLFPRAGSNLAGLNNLSPITVDKLTNALEGESLNSITDARRRMGPAGFLGDLNTAFTDLTGGLADTPGLNKQTVREAYRQRAAAQGQRVDQALTSAMGPNVNVEDFKNMITENRAKAADPLYTQWRNTQVQPTQALKDLIPRLESAGAFNMAEELSGITGNPVNKNFFTGGNQKDYPTTQSWDYVKQGLDRRIDQAYSSGDKTLGRALVGLKSELVSEIEKTPAGGIWKQARQEFASRSALLDQIQAGQDIFLGGRSGLSVDELQQELRGLSGPELQARIVGLRNAANQAMGETIRGDTTLRNKLLAPNNQDKMRLLLGDDKAGKLIESMGQEKYLGDQTQNIIGGSPTAPKTERIAALKPKPLPTWNPSLTEPLSIVPPHIREAFRPASILDAWRGQSNSNANQEMAQILTTPEGRRMGGIIRALLAETRRRGEINQTAGRAGSAISGLIAGPGTTTARRELFPAQ